jgi:hypothetical protein
MCELALRLLWTRNRPVAEISIWQHKNIHRRQSPVRSELAIPASGRPHTHALNRAFNEISVSSKNSHVQGTNKCEGRIKHYSHGTTKPTHWYTKYRFSSSLRIWWPSRTEVLHPYQIHHIQHPASANVVTGWNSTVWLKRTPRKHKTLVYNIKLILIIRN